REDIPALKEKKDMTRTAVSETIKTQVRTEANELIETVLKPQHVQPPPDEPRFNYIVDIYGRWYQRYFYFCPTYRSPNPNAVTPTFETKFARLEYEGPNSFNLSFMRHTGQWVVLYTDLSLNECLEAIRDEPLFMP